MTSEHELRITTHVSGSEYLKYLFCQMNANLAIILGKAVQENKDAGNTTSDIPKEQEKRIVDALVGFSFWIKADIKKFYCVIERL